MCQNADQTAARTTLQRFFKSIQKWLLQWHLPAKCSGISKRKSMHKPDMKSKSLGSTRLQNNDRCGAVFAFWLRDLKCCHCACHSELSVWTCQWSAHVEAWKRFSSQQVWLFRFDSTLEVPNCLTIRGNKNFWEDMEWRHQSTACPHVSKITLFVCRTSVELFHQPLRESGHTGGSMCPWVEVNKLSDFQAVSNPCKLGMMGESIQKSSWIFLLRFAEKRSPRNVETEAIPGHWPFRSMGPPSTSLHPLKMQLRNGKLLVWAVSWPSSGHNQRRSSSWDNYTWLSALKILNKISLYPSTSIPAIAWQSMTKYVFWTEYMLWILTWLYYRDGHIDRLKLIFRSFHINMERYALSNPEKNLPPVQSPQIHRSQDLEKSPTCLAEWHGGKTWALRHQIWWLSARIYILHTICFLKCCKTW